MAVLCWEQRQIASQHLLGSHSKDSQWKDMRYVLVNHNYKLFVLGFCCPRQGALDFKYCG